MTTSWNTIIPNNPGGTPLPRSYMGMVYSTINSTIYMFGGSGTGEVYLNDMWSYNVSVPNAQWTSVAMLPLQTPLPRNAMGMVYSTINSTIYMFGGGGTGYVFLNDMWSYNVSDPTPQWTSISMTNPMTESGGMGMVYSIINSTIYMFGGQNTITGNLNTTWSYNVVDNPNTEWTSISMTGDIPSPRFNMGMVYSIFNSTIYMFGGYSDNYKNDVWSYNVGDTNAQWMYLSITDSPSGRYRMSMVYSNFNYNMYIFGGYNGSTSTNDLLSLSYNYACFQQGTPIMTPAGYCCIENLKAGDDVTLYNSSGASTPIIELIHFKCDQTQCPLYCLPKDALSENIPLHDLYMAGNHAFKDLAGQWHHMKCADNVHSVNKETIDYYHIVTSDYYAHTICAEGVEVETCFTDKSDGKSLVWVCNKTCCTPYIKQSTNDSELSSITM